MNRRRLGAAALTLAALLACGEGNGGGRSGPGLVILEGPRVVGPGGRLSLSAVGSGTGALSWAMVPPGLGTFVPDAPPVIQAPTSPPLSYGLRGTFTAGPTPGSAEFQVSAGEGAQHFQVSTLLRVVQGITVSPSAQEVQVTPHLQRWITVAVAAPGHATSQVPQEVAWSPEGDFADGQILASAPGSLVFNSPTRAGTYRLKGVAVADPAASALVRVVVQ